MQLFTTFPDDLPADTDLRTFLSHTALIISSSQHEAATALLRQQFYRPPQQKSPPLLKRAAYHILRRGPRFSPDEKIPASSLRRILILRHDGLGDYILTTPLLQWLKQAVPHAEIDVLTSQRNDFLAALDPHVSLHVPIYDRPQFHYSFLHAHKLLGKRRYDLVFAIVMSKMTRQAVIARSLAPEADYVTILNCSSAALHGQVLHRQVANQPWQQHWCEAFYSTGPATIEPGAPIQMMPPLWVPHLPSAEENIRLFLRTYGLSSETGRTGDGASGQPYVVFNLSAHDQERSLTYEQALSTCRLLRERFPHYALVIVSSPVHRTMGERLAEYLGPPVYYYHNTFLEMIPLLNHARWVITPDTALVHVAAAQKVPVIGLYHRPPTVCEWFPYQTLFQIVLRCDPRGLCTVAPEAIVAAAEQLERALHRPPATAE